MIDLMDALHDHAITEELLRLALRELEHYPGYVYSMHRCACAYYEDDGTPKGSLCAWHQSFVDKAVENERAKKQ